MTLVSGTHLGPYEIWAVLGDGGMGEVYRARDTRLNRPVAIKVLAAGLSDDPKRRERFEREARAISSLNHPHICTLYDVGHQEGVDYLVMELLDGQTLSERLARGALPLEQALQYAVQIASALDAAHRKGIIHRDLKPANIFLARSGGPSGPPTAKLLDFGIAKAVAPGAPVATAPPTLTEEGTLLGTVQYMAPEQLEGREADARSDLFAFGAVLYEMLTGRRAFPGENQSKVIAAVLDSEPAPLAATQPLTPPALEHLVRTCLAKNPDERWQSAGDVKRQLEWIAASLRTGVVPPTTVHRSSDGTRARWMGAAALVAAAAALSLLTWPWAQRRAQSLPPETRLEISTPPTTEPWSIAISPDGRTVAFVADAAGQAALWVRPLDAEARQLPETTGASLPFWSPDNQSIGFFAEGKLKRVEIKGGAPQVLADAAQPHGGAWGRDGSIVFSPHQVSTLLRRVVRRRRAGARVATGGRTCRSPLPPAAPGRPPRPVLRRGCAGNPRGLCRPARPDAAAPAAGCHGAGRLCGDGARPVCARERAVRASARRCSLRARGRGGPGCGPCDRAIGGRWIGLRRHLRFRQRGHHLPQRRRGCRASADVARSIGKDRDARGESGPCQVRGGLVHVAERPPPGVDPSRERQHRSLARRTRARRRHEPAHVRCGGRQLRPVVARRPASDVTPPTRAVRSTSTSDCSTVAATSLCS